MTIYALGRRLKHFPGLVWCLRSSKSLPHPIGEGTAYLRNPKCTAPRNTGRKQRLSNQTTWRQTKWSTNPSVENSSATASSSTLSLTTEICCLWRNSPSSPYSRNNNFWVEIWPMTLHYWRSYALWCCGPIQDSVKWLNDKTDED